jgi:hypothetical protein
VVDPSVSTAGSRRTSARVADRHPAHPHREGERRDRGQPLGDDGDRERDRDLGHLGDLAAPEQPDPEQRRGPDHDPDRQPAAELIETALQRRLGLLGGAGELGDPSHLGATAGRDHDPTTTAGQHGRAQEHHVDQVTDRSVFGDQVGRLGDRVALPGQPPLPRPGALRPR